MLTENCELHSVEEGMTQNKFLDLDITEAHEEIWKRMGKEKMSGKELAEMGIVILRDQVPGNKLTGEARTTLRDPHTMLINKERKPLWKVWMENLGKFQFHLFQLDTGLQLSFSEVYHNCRDPRTGNNCMVEFKIVRTDPQGRVLYIPSEEELGKDGRDLWSLHIAEHNMREAADNALHAKLTPIRKESPTPPAQKPHIPGQPVIYLRPALRLLA